ncbi:ATP-binding protein [Hoyosella sp. YIM 151337]|uniref:ATP-binding protein n=1 Tax=Hoyosella sp. YIM 151337 TaxID=2992742 RepID=UPI002236B951|nr:ATP-binding protein [Hoyosella sp. YIM 151337]MCW4353519.1 ATP-binding protein [Hoyosella sp. YIM 151337]
MIEMSVGVSAEAGSTFSLDASRFNRHTFWCGQSGSGKTYALGVVLERLMLQTALPMLIFDPNADFVSFGKPRADAPPEVSARLGEADVRVFRPRGEADQRLTVRFVDMDLASRAAVLRLDPILDAEEYNVLVRMESEAGAAGVDALIERLRDAPAPGARKLLLRLENLRVLQWDVWAYGGRGVEDVIDQRPDATVLDLGGFKTTDEFAAAALAVLDQLWAKREERRPVLMVIDEAHNLCPQNPVSPAQRALCERIIQIAAEGRKFGLWLLLSTQRPSKIHTQVLSQCDNLCLMKLNSRNDLAEIADFFGTVPEVLLGQAPNLRKGQAILAGGFAPEPAIVQVASRFTLEGGTDVSVPLRHDGASVESLA